MRWSGGIFLCAIFVFASCRSTVPDFPAGMPATVEGYKKAVEDRLGTLWYLQINANISRAQLGVVHLTFDVPAAGGPVSNLKVVSNTGGPVDEEFAVTAVRRLRVAPIPSAVLPSLEKDRLQFDETFTIFANPPASPTPAPTPSRTKRA